MESAKEHKEGAADMDEANVESLGEEAMADAETGARATVEQERRERAAQALT
jgi:hypothetical protein